MAPTSTARRLAVLLSIAAGSLAPLPAAALADSAPSAGDQQYTDPLNAPSTTPTTHHAPSTSAPSTSAPVASAPSNTLATNSSVIATNPTTAGRKLPFTGYDGGLAAALGAGLVAGGVVLRRRLSAPTTR